MNNVKVSVTRKRQQMRINDKQILLTSKGLDRSIILHANSIGHSSIPPELETGIILESEKCKLGQELHDGVNPLLSTALLYLSLIEPVNKKGKKVKNTIHKIIIEAINCIRHLASDMLISNKDKHDFCALVESYIDTIKQTGKFSVEVDVERNNVPIEMTSQAKIHLYRIIQEQMNNIIKYSQAKNVFIQLRSRPEEGLYLLIKDDGVGFDTSKAANGVGILNMQKRVSQLNGVFDIQSSPGNGCSISVCLPQQNLTVCPIPAH